jgi:hypothetical protein
VIEERQPDSLELGAELRQQIARALGGAQPAEALQLGTEHLEAICPEIGGTAFEVVRGGGERSGIIDRERGVKVFERARRRGQEQPDQLGDELGLATVLGIGERGEYAAFEGRLDCLVQRRLLDDRTEAGLGSATANPTRRLQIARPRPVPP